MLTLQDELIAQFAEHISSIVDERASIAAALRRFVAVECTHLGQSLS